MIVAEVVAAMAPAPRASRSRPAVEGMPAPVAEAAADGRGMPAAEEGSDGG